MREGPEPPDLVEEVFRRHSARLTAALVRAFGVGRIDAIEDALQEAFVKAIVRWAAAEPPSEPAAWLFRVASNHILDRLRREAREGDPAALDAASTLDRPETLFEGEVDDDELRALFACCHPSLAVEAQLALALRLLCGLSVEQIARAMLAREPAVARRLHRAKTALRNLGDAFEIPAGPALTPRLGSVQRALYLLFNEGYAASSGEPAVLHELCRDATRLAEALADHPTGDAPSTHALLALFFLHQARLPARLREDGSLVLLADQDRSLWDGTMIDRGLVRLALSATGNRPSVYHLEAGIAACHATARSYRDTDWRRIRTLYDALLEMTASPVVALNRAVAVRHVDGPEAALAALGGMETSPLAENHLYYAVLADLHTAVGNAALAEQCLREALERSTVAAEHLLLAERLRRLGEGDD